MGQKQAAYNAGGIIVAFYDTSDSPAPSGANVIDITDEQWQACINANSQGYTVESGALMPPNAAFLLAQARAAQCAIIDSAYYAASQANVSFKTAGGVTYTFQADSDSQTLVMQSTQGFQIAGGVPTGFFWKSADNTLVPFTLADLEGLYLAMLSQGWAAFQKRTALKAQIAAATTIAAAQAITWN